MREQRVRGNFPARWNRELFGPEQGKNSEEQGTKKAEQGSAGFQQNDAAASHSIKDR
jgi:hypothetical protein